MVKEKDGRNKKNKFVTLLSRRLPIINWVRRYTLKDAISDFIAGITLGLTMVPQSIAYAALAGLTPQDGLNSALVGCIIYAFFGTIKEVVIGPTSLMALLTYEYTANLSRDFVVLLGLLCGLVEFVMGLLHLGFLVELISAPVVSGFTTATSLIIIVSQMKSLIGISFKSNGIVGSIRKLYQNIYRMRLGDSTLGIVSIISLLMLRKLKDIKIREGVACRSVLLKLFWFLSTGRNAIAVVASALLALHYKSSGGSVPFITTKCSDASLPSIKFPPTSTTLGNKTYNFQEMVVELGTGYIVIPVISILANVAIAKAFVNGAVDTTQEMLALSLCNVAGSLVQSMPTTGAFTRSAVASASGIRTPIAGLYAASITLMALGFLGPYFHYIPKATLAAILISAVLFLIDWQIVKRLWKKCWLDLFTVGVTLVSCMAIGVEIGLLIGVTVGLFHLIYQWARPDILVQTSKVSGVNIVTVTPKGGFYFPAVDYISSIITKAGLYEGKGKDLVNVDCSRFTGTDYTVTKGIITLKTAFDKRGQPIQFVNVPKNCYEIWTSGGCKKNYFSSHENGYNSLGEYVHSLKNIGGETAKEQEGDELLKHQDVHSSV